MIPEEFYLFWKNGHGLCHILSKPCSSIDIIQLKIVFRLVENK